METAFEKWQKMSSDQDLVVSELSKKINSYLKSEMGLVIEEIRNTDEYKQLDILFKIEFKKLQTINSFICKNFKKELNQYHDNLRKSKML